MVARRQTGAYGRQGRAWSSPEGGLYFSFILDPLHAHPHEVQRISQLPSLSLVMSLGVRFALSSMASDDSIKIKWPNDIVVVRPDMPLGHYAKICGISLEAVQGKLCCGVGINVFRPDGPLEGSPDQAPARAYDLAYLEDLVPSLADASNRQLVLDDLLARLLDSIERAYAQWLEMGIEAFIRRYDDALFNLGQYVMLDTIDGKLLHEGKVLGVSEAGELLLETADGETIRVASGEVHTRAPSV